MSAPADVTGTLSHLCWPYKSLPDKWKEAALRESEVDMLGALEDLRKPECRPGLVAYALRRLEGCMDYGREPVDLHVDIALELWRLVKEESFNNGLRRKCAAQLQQKLRHLRKQFVKTRGLRPFEFQAESVEKTPLRRLLGCLDWRVVVTIMLDRLQQTSRGSPVEPPSSLQHLAESMAGLVNEFRYWTPQSDVEEVVTFFEQRMDPSQKSIVLFSRLMLMVLPAECSEDFVKDGRVFRWWDLLPRGANSRFNMMWTALPARAAKVRWASGQPRPAECVLSEERLSSWLDLVTCTMSLPVEASGKGPELDAFTEDCAWAFLGKTTYKLVAKYLAYSLEPLESATKPFPKGSTWAALQLVLRRLAACAACSGQWTWHVHRFLIEVVRGYYVRVCRERFQEPGCTAHPSFHMTAASDEAFVNMIFPLIRDMLTLQTGGGEPGAYPLCLILSFMCNLAVCSSTCWEPIRSFLQSAVEALADPMSTRHTSTLYLLTQVTPVLVRTAPGLILEAAELALHGVESTDVRKTIIASSFFVNLFVQVPTLDLSSRDLPDRNDDGLRGVLPVPPGASVVPSASAGDLQIVTSLLPDLCRSLLERYLTLVQAQPKPSKKDIVAAADLTGSRLLSTALFLAVKQGDPSMVQSMTDQLVDWVSLTLCGKASKSVGMLVASFALASPEAAGKVIDSALKKLGSASALADKNETELLWYIHVLGSAARFGGRELLSRRGRLEEMLRATLNDNRKVVRKVAAKLCRRVLAGLTSPFCGDLTGDGTVEEALARWGGTRSLGWAAPMRPLKLHEPTAEEVEFAKSLCRECIALAKKNCAGSDEDIHAALSLMKSIIRGVACLYPDERQGAEATPLVSAWPNDGFGQELFAELSQILLDLCPKLGCPGHPFEATASEASSRAKLLCKALQVVAGLVKGERKPEVPDLFQIRGFDNGNVRMHISTESFTPKVHFMSSWRDLSRIRHHWEVLWLVNRRLQRRPSGFKFEGVRRQLGELLCSYVLNANSLVSAMAADALNVFLRVHYGAKHVLLNDCLLPLQEKTVAGKGGLDAERAHLAESALEGFARSAARLFVTSTWRRSVPDAIQLAAASIRAIHAFTEDGVSVIVKPSSLTMQFELLAKWITGRSATSPGKPVETCKAVAPLLAMLRRPGVHWRTKVCILSVVSPALRILHASPITADQLDREVLRTWLTELVGCLTAADLQSQLGTLAINELGTAMRSALKLPATPLAAVMQEVLPRERGFVAQVAKVMSALHQGFMGGESGAPAQADIVQVVVRACIGHVGVLHLGWQNCPSGQSWMVHSTFFQTFVALCTKRGDPHLLEELQSLLRSLNQQAKSEAEDHVAFLEVLGGTLRAARRWPEARQDEFWAGLGPVATEELKMAEEENIRNWQFLVYYVVIGPSRRLSSRPDAKSEDASVLRLATFLTGNRIGGGAPEPVMPIVVVSKDEDTPSTNRHVTRLRLLLVLLSTLQRRTSAISDETRLTIVRGLAPSLKEGISHPYKQMREESAKALAFCLNVGATSEVLTELRGWVSARAAELGAVVRDACKESDTSTACEGVVFVFLHGLMGRRLRSLALESVDLLLSAAAADSHDLKMLAALALGFLAQSPQRQLGMLAFAEKLVACAQVGEGEDANSAQRAKRLGAASGLIGSAALRHHFQFSLCGDGKATGLCRERLMGLLGDKRVEVRVASQTALAPLLCLDSEAGCRKMARDFANTGSGDEAALDRAVHGLSAMLRAAGNLGVPGWLGDVIEALSKVGKHQQAKKEVEKTVQAFLKQQQQSRDVWKRCQEKLTEEQMDLLKARRGTMSYYS